MRYSPLTIKQKGLETHVTERGYSYEQLLGYFDNGATDTFINRKLKDKEGHAPSLHTVAKWRKVYKHEKLQAAHDKAVEELKDI